MDLKKDFIERITVLAETLNEAKEYGVPGISLASFISKEFYSIYLEKRFNDFIKNAEIDHSFILKICNNDSYFDCFFATLETIRQTHSKLGLIALALVYKDHPVDEEYLINALHAFSQISDKTINSFITLYEEIPDGQDYLVLHKKEGDDLVFHTLYSDAVELIRRNFFVLSGGASHYANGPVKGMRWTHTKSYYDYCKQAIEIHAQQPSQ